MKNNGFLLEAKGVTKRFHGFLALHNVHLTVPENTIVGLIGPNGSGKSTMFNCLSGFYPYESGEVHFKGERITGLLPHDIARRGLVRTFQLAKAPKAMTCLENMLLACEDDQGLEKIFGAVFKRREIKRQERLKLKKAHELLEIVGISHLSNEFSGNLSGGQQKLLSLARILIRNPDLILLDEPAAGVNPTLVLKFMDLVKKLRNESGKTFLIVEHDMNFISKVCDQVFVLDAGINLAEGTPDIIRTDPKVLEVYLGGGRK